MRIIALASMALALATPVGAAHTSISVDFAFEVRDTLRAHDAKFDKQVGKRIAETLDDKVGFLELVPGTKGDQPYHLHVQVVPTSGSRRTKLTYIKFELTRSIGEPFGADLTVRELFIQTAELASLQGRTAAQDKILDKFVEKLSQITEKIVTNLFSRIPLREDPREFGYYQADGGHAYISLPYFYSELAARPAATKFQVRTVAAPEVKVDMLSMSYKDEVAGRKEEFELAFGETTAGYPEDYWKSDYGPPIVCSVTSLPDEARKAVETDGGGKDRIRLARLHVVEYEHHDWPLPTNRAGSQAGGTE